MPMREEQFQLHEELEERHWWFLARRRILHTLVHAFTPPSLSTLIVDVGCGTGGNVGILADEYATLGIDPSSQAIASARKRFPKTEFICGIAPRDLGCRASEAALFLLTDVLEHVKDDREFLSSLLTFLRPGTGILLTVPADMSLWSPHDVSFGHFRRYSRATLSQVLAGLPVTIRLLSYYNTRLYPIIRGVRMLSRWRAHASGVAGTDFRSLPSPMNWLLENIFAGERVRLKGQLEGHSLPYTHGASLIALLVSVRKDEHHSHGS